MISGTQHLTINRKIRPIHPIVDQNPHQLPLWLAQLMANRSGGCTACGLSLQNLLMPNQLLGMDQAIELLAKAKKEKWHISILGDFDTDGATACTLLMRGMKKLGFLSVNFFVPNRFEHGYGLSPKIVDHICAHQKPDIIITVDNGINACEGVEYAKKLGIKTLITDHHLPGSQLPCADVIINPNQPNCPFGSKNLAGVGVAFYLMAALKKELAQVLDMKQFLPLVAIGTVADMVSLDTNNRILVKHGIKMIRAQKISCGILALCKISRIDPNFFSESDISFLIAPKLNAAGRLADMSVGIQTLLTDNTGDANTLVAQLTQFNQKRQAIQADMLEKASQLVNPTHPILSIYDPQFHEGVVGIIAGQLKEKHKKASLVFAQTQSGIKGSVRSIVGLHIKDFLEQFHQTYPQHIQTFGGHAMAAGLTLQTDNFELFQNDLVAFYQQHAPKNLEQQPISDGALDVADISIENTKLIEQLGPWGVGFDVPVFEGRFILASHRIFSEKAVRFCWQVAGGKQVESIYFGEINPPYADGQPYDMLYQLMVNRFNGKETLQLRLVELKGLVV